MKPNSALPFLRFREDGKTAVADPGLVTGSNGGSPARCLNAGIPVNAFLPLIFIARLILLFHMKLFTRCFLLLTTVLGPLTSVLATTVTVTINNNFYAPMTVAIHTGDVVNFVWVAGVHPTTSDSATPAWATFTLGASSPSKAITFATAGTFPYHCEAHGYVGGGQNGIITVTQGAASAASDARLTSPGLSIFPNPSHGQVTVQLNQKAGADYKLRLSNIIGQEVRTIALKPELSSAGLPLDLSDLHAGLYFYSLVVDGKVVTTKRIVLQN